MCKNNRRSQIFSKKRLVGRRLLQWHAYFKEWLSIAGTLVQPVIKTSCLRDLKFHWTARPLLKEEEVMSALKLSQGGESVLPPVNVLELSDSFMVEMAIPGLKREDFLVHSEGNALSVYVLHKKPWFKEKEKFQLHEFNYECFDRQIILPRNADSELANAEYKEGILRLSIPKTEVCGKNVRTEIAVY